MSEPNDSFRPTGLRARLLAIVLLVAVPLALLLFAYAAIENGAAQDRARADVKVQLQSDAGSISDLVTQARATLVTFGITYAIQARDWALVQGNADRLLAAHPEYATIAVADSRGMVRASSPIATGTVGVSGDVLFERAVSERQLVLSDYGRDPVTGRPAVRVGLPVYGKRGELIVVEYIAFSPQQFTSRLKAVAIPGSTELLVDSAGRLVTQAPERGVAPGKGLIGAILGAQPGHLTTTGPDGVTRQYLLASAVTGQPDRLRVAIGYSLDSLLADQRRALGVTLGGFAVVTLLVLLVAAIVGDYSIFRPTQQLENAAERLADGDLSARVDFAGRRDEFGRLGGEFNDMAASLETHVDELQKARGELSRLNADLEQRVRRRTAELEASNKELEAFSYSVSHDLRSPLRAIDGFSQALLEDYGEELDGEAKDDLLRIRGNTKRMGELIDSLLTLSRLSRQEMHLEKFDMTALAEESAAAVSQEWPDRDVKVRIEPGLTALGDPALIRIVMDNLLRNAFKFTSKHETALVEVGSADEGEETVFFVRDDGAGFDMAYADKLFGAFQRIHGQAEFPGIGIGLATTARIVHRHGGRIWAEGELEKGATFSFTL